MSYVIAVGGCLMAVIGAGIIALFLFGSGFPDTDFEWPEEDERLWPAP